jgi:uncharacterized membrane protein
MLTAIFRNQNEAMEAYNWLRKHGYSLEEINVLLSERHKQRFHDIQHDDKIELKQKDLDGSGKRGLMGTTLGALVVSLCGGATSLLLSELGLLSISPLPAVLAGLGAGAMFGGLAGGLVGYGFPDTACKEYEAVLHNGGIAIGVKPHNLLEERIIKSEFEKLHGEKILMA